MQSALKSLLVLSLVMALIPMDVSAGFISSWDASSGLHPNQISPAWTLTDTAEPENAVLAGGVLTLSTNPDAELMNYRHSAPIVDTTDPFFMEARVRSITGSSSANQRAPIAIGFTTAPGIGNILFIGTDEVFFINPGDVKGPTAVVDTNNAFHTYRIEVNAGAISLFYDSVLTLTASSINEVGLNGSVERIFWGEATTLAFGTSQWQSFRHNALVDAPAVPEPTSLALCGIGALGMMFGARRRRKQQPVAAA